VGGGRRDGCLHQPIVSSLLQTDRLHTISCLIRACKQVILELPTPNSYKPSSSLSQCVPPLFTSDAMAVPSASDECDVDLTSAACIEYSSKVDELRQILETASPMTNKIRSIALEMKAIKMKPVDMPVGADSPAVRAALKAAKAATAEYGADSTEAKLAWESLEEISSASEALGALGGSLTDECLTEMIEACEALDELQRAIDVVNAIESSPAAAAN
jgi:hypothetical protein